ncbi:MAG: hypothetical protein ACE5FO_04950 [Parvularculaceae bacterium]
MESLKAPFGALVLAAAFVSAAPGAAQIISYRYDGAYIGAANLERSLSDASCTPTLPLVRLEIRNGILRAYEENGRQIVKGFVTGDGFFTSDYIFDDGRTTLFEGMVNARGRLTGGIVDGACAWVVELSKLRRD